MQRAMGSSDNKTIPWKLIIWGSIGILFLIALNFWLVYECEKINGFGFSQALFSGAAFLGLIVTILIQRKELKNQNSSLEAQWKEMQETKKEFEQQNLTLKIQRIENTLMNLIENLNDEKKSFVIKHGESYQYGKDFFERVVADVKKNYSSNRGDNHDLTTLRDAFKEIIRRKNIENIIQAYVRKIVFYLNTVDSHQFLNVHEENERLKQFYARMLKSNLSNAEMAVLFVYGLAPPTIDPEDPDKNDLKALIERFGLLSDIQRSDLINDELMNEYDGSAFNDHY